MAPQDNGIDDDTRTRPHEKPQRVNVLAADTQGWDWVADVDDRVVYVDYRLPPSRFAWAVSRGTLALHSGLDSVPEARRLNGHLRAVPDAS